MSKEYIEIHDQFFEKGRKDVNEYISFKYRYNMEHNMKEPNIIYATIEQDRLFRFDIIEDGVKIDIKGKKNKNQESPTLDNTNIKEDDNEFVNHLRKVNKKNLEKIEEELWKFNWIEHKIWVKNIGLLDGWLHVGQSVYIIFKYKNGWIKVDKSELKSFIDGKIKGKEPIKEKVLYEIYDRAGDQIVLILNQDLLDLPSTKFMILNN